jgi:hypothetical protein
MGKFGINVFEHKLFIAKTVKIYISLAFVVILLHFLLQTWHPLGRTYSIFYLDEEVTVATMFTSTIAIVTAVGFFEYAYSLGKDNFRKILNYLVGIFFLLLAADEYFSIHEYLNTVIRTEGTPVNALNSVAETSWVFSLGFLIAIVLLGLLYYIWKEDESRVQASYRLGLLFFIFVIIMEPIGGYFFGQWFYSLMVATEELSEMLGICFFMNGIYIKASRK